MSIVRLNVAARFIVVLLIGLLFQVVISIVSLVDLKQSMLKDRTSEVRHLLETGYSTLVYFHHQQELGLLSEKQAQEAAAAVVRNLHYDARNYFFIWDLDGRSIAHGGNSQYEGKNFLSGPDAERLPVVSTMVQRLVEVTRSPAHEGVTRYKIPRAGQTVPLDKLAYCKLYAPWGWSIGTGAYIDDIDDTFNARAGELLIVLLALMLVAGVVTYYVVHDLVLAMRRLSARISSLTNGELISDIPDVDRHDEVGTMARALLVLRDTSKEVSELKLDHLTGLPTRKLLMDRIRQAKLRSARSNQFNALMLLDLDKFKSLNDTHGHDAGDRLLKEVSVRLTKSLRESDTVARLGGDEFVVLLTDLGDDQVKAGAIATRIAGKIMESLAQDYYLGHIVHHSGASAGMTLFRGKTVAADDLLKEADIAMYKSKVSGTGVCRFFEEDTNTGTGPADFEMELGTALAERQFVLHYQPQIGVDGSLLGCEALLRWHHPLRGLIMPGEFLPLAEKKGLLGPLGNMALELVCSQIAAWHDHPALRGVKVSLNICTGHFRRAEFVDQMLAVIQKTRIHPASLMLELSEHVFANNIPIVIEKMVAIRTLGVGFSIHDFGSGYAPLPHLARMPIQQVKLSREMVQQVFADTASLATPKMLLSMAHSLGLSSIAVGVETVAQRECLAQAGCSGFQGNLYCEAVPAEQVVAFIQGRAVNVD